MNFLGRFRLPASKAGYIDPHQREKIQPSTEQRYRQIVSLFGRWLLDNGLCPYGAESWDDAMVEFKQSTPKLKKHEFENLVAAVEFVFPRFKGIFALSRAILSGWRISYVTKHILPMGRGVASLFGAYCSSQRMARLGIGCVFQQRKGLRPGEMLSIESQHVVLSDNASIPGHPRHLVVNLGVRQGTKVKRPQSVVVRENEDPDLFRLLLLVKLYTADGSRLFPYTLEQYRSRLKAFSSFYHLQYVWTPHSPRAGFASEARARGRPFTEIQEEGRWISASSLRVYIDCVGAASITTDLHKVGLTQAQAFCIVNLELYFPVSAITDQ